MARLTSVQGEVELRHGDAMPWQAAGLDDVLCVGTTIRTQAFSRAALAFTNESTLRLDQLTTLTISGEREERQTWLDMLTGAIHFFSHRPRSLNIKTPFVNAAAEGTEFMIRLGFDEGQIFVYEGMVLAKNDQGELLRSAGDAALLRRAQKPIPLVVARPRDAVAWALHYQPVLSDLAAGPEPGAYPAPLHIAINRTRDGDYEGALHTLDLAKPDQKDARLETFRAGIFLTIGRVGDAEAALERALALDSDYADAYAQRTMLHVVRNNRNQALRDADRAVSLDPDSSAALIAQSYARQASFDLEGARESLREAVQKDPDDALAFARLSEIELSFADYDRANEAADQAVRLAPNLARTQTVRGFSYLAAINTGAARTAFTRAIELESTDPLAHLGQGLAKIRDGDLDAGRRDLEIAASLDPNNALIRSYLGKAYFEEKRGPKDATQFEIAKQLDPNDPTPWFYDAIRKQTENRPIEALRDLQKAIELNDNRAVYRSRLLLDTDRAARGVSIAQSYDELGFKQLAINEASRSTSFDPANHSAHRFLSDAYAKRRRHEIARVSELLRAQLLQPININPSQPVSKIADLSTSSSNFRFASINEYSGLFERNQARANFSGLVGNNHFLGNEILISTIHDQASISLGQFYSKDDGFRPNNDIENKIYDILAQFQINRKSGIQLGYSDRNVDQGAISLDFDTEQFDPNERLKVDESSARIGLRHNLNQDHIILVSYINSRRNEESTFGNEIITPVGSIFLDNNSENKATGNQLELQHLYQKSWINITSGYSWSDTKDKLSEQIQITFPDNTTRTTSNDFGATDRKNENFYLYSDSRHWNGLIWTLGLGYASQEADLIEDISRITPKLGLQWQLMKPLSFRAAAMRTLKRPIVTNQTLEPTTIAGFNQFFDDPIGTIADRLGFGIDASLSNDLYIGAEFTRRDLKIPFSRIDEDGNFLGSDFREQKEKIYTTYLYWLAAKDISFVFQPEYDLFEDVSPRTNSSTKIDTLSLPISINYFDESGFYAGLTSTYVYQKIEPGEFVDLPDDKDKFFLIDVNLGYKMRKREGSIDLEINNVFDNEFSFLDNEFQVQEISVRRYVPSRSIIGRLTLRF